MKKCPKCGADNKPDSSACYNCFAPLADVQPTVTSGPLNAQPLTGPETTQPMQPEQSEQQAEPAPLTGSDDYTPRSSGPLTGPLTGPPTGQPAQEENQQTVVGQPLGGQQQPPSPYGPPPQQRYHRHEESVMTEPVKSSGPGAIIAVVLILAIIGGAFAYWKFVVQANAPINVVRKFMVAAKKSDVNEMNKYICASNKSLPGFEQNFASGYSRGMDLSGGNKESIEGKQYVLVQGPIEGTTATVYIKPGPDSNSGPVPAGFEKGLPLVLVKEEGKWKLDFIQTIQKMIGPGLMRQLQQQGGRNSFGGSFPK